MIVFVLFRSVALGFVLFWLSLYNGLSGQQPLETFIYAMYNVNMVNFAVGFYVVFEVDVSVRKYGYSLAAEDKMPFKMSQMYKASFKIAKTFLRTYLCFFLYAIFTGAVIYYTYKWGILETGGIMDSSGKNFDLFSYGMIAITCLDI